ncbi:MAG: PHP domain-containing protein [Clostridiales bacterium]|nr:PHP domain-containing protein [Clostridiales bacterium]
MSGDLHCHTKLSDGTLGLEELIALAAKRGVDTIAITDHDCLAGTIRGKIIGDRNGIRVIPGVEISALDKQGKNVHILAYLFDSPDRIEGLCHKNALERKKAGQYMMLKAAQKYPITKELVIKCASGSTNLYKQHIMHALMQCGYTMSIYGELYDELFNPSSPSNICVQPKFADVFDVIEAVKNAGGISVLAHPVLYDNFDIIDELIDAGLNGIEVWHPTCSKENEERLISIAKSHKLLMTGGSDFHGMYNHGTWSVGDYSTPKQQLNELLNYKTKIKRQQKKLAAMQAAEQI